MLVEYVEYMYTHITTMGIFPKIAHGLLDAPSKNGVTSITLDARIISPL